MKVELAIHELEAAIRKREGWANWDHDKVIQRQIDQLRAVIRLLQMIQFGG